jgi:RNA recognition motif-containing protein
MAEASGDVLVDVPLNDVAPSLSSSSLAPSSDSAPSPTAVTADALPSPTFSLTASSHFLYSEAQRERAETTDDGISPYVLLRRKFYSAEQWQTLLAKLAATRTLYVGNLSFYTTEAQLMAFFAQCGRVVKVVMGLNERTMTPCGFCFVEFSSHKEALDCQRHLSGLMADERQIRADLDPVSTRSDTSLPLPALHLRSCSPSAHRLSSPLL